MRHSGSVLVAFRGGDGTMFGPSAVTNLRAGRRREGLARVRSAGDNPPAA
jgi:hypothetical protein